MGFKKMVRAQYPPRQWSLVGYPGSGKSTFASQLNGPTVVVDADHRFQEVLPIAKDEVFELSDNKTDNINPDDINRMLVKNMPGSGVRTIVVDSLTAIIAPLVVQAMVDNDNKKNRNLSAAFRTKALAMRQLQDAVTRWGTDVLWIYHLQDSRDAQAKEVTRSTVSQTELARLTRSINAQLEIVYDDRNDRRGIKIVWARRGRSGMVLWDEVGQFRGMPERVEEAMYDGLSADEQDRLEKETPAYFPNPETALSWSIDRGAFESIARARDAYDTLKDTRNPSSARDMAEFWIEHVDQIVMTMGLDDQEPADQDIPEIATNDEDGCPF